MGNYHFDRLKDLFGGKIISAFIVGIDDEEMPVIKELTINTDMKVMRDDFIGIMIQMPNGNVKGMMIMQDEEGNGPGAFDILDLSLTQDDVDAMIARMSDVITKRELMVRRKELESLEKKGTNASHSKKTKKS